MKYFVTIVFLVIAYFSFSLAQIPADGLIAYYSFDGSGNDLSGNGNNGTPHGGISYVVDRFGNAGYAAYFNGDSAYYDVPNSTSLSSPTNEIAISLWCSLETPTMGLHPFLSKSDNIGIAGEYSLIYVLDQNVLDLHLNSEALHGAMTLSNSTWYHLVASWDGSKIIYYVNGDSVAERNYNTPLNHQNLPLMIGCDVPGATDYFKGILDDVRIYNRSLTVNDVQALYHNNYLLAYYPFNGDAKDESGNGNNGTTNGGVSWVIDRFGEIGKAAEFNGIDSYIDCGNSEMLNAYPITLSAWVKTSEPTTHQHEGIVGKYEAGSQNGYQLFMQDGSARSWYYRDGSNYVNDNAGLDGRIINDEKWHLIVLTIDQDSGKFFVDKSLKISKQWEGTAGVTSTNQHLLIGNYYSGFFNGAIDDIRIYNRALSEQEIKSLYSNYRQQIVSVKDIPNDQGGKVRIKWDKIYLDSTGTTPPITSYGVWRKIPPGMSVTKHLPSPTSILNDTLGVLYDYLGTVNATQSPSYNFVAQTLQDSSESGINAETFLITAHTADPNVYYISDAAMGYSVDNITPSAVTSLAAVWQTVPRVDLSWDGNPKETDFQRYEIYKSTTKNFVPSLGLRIGTSINPQYQDADVTDGYRYYYQAYSVDSHGNKSEVREVSIHGNSIPKIISLNNNWNMVSVPMDMDDYSKESLFPTVVSSIFKFDGSYQTVATLENGTGYWAKFNYAQEQTQNGFYKKEVRISVKDGWNMIGSLSELVSVSNITSEPAGMVTSQIFGYNGSYQMVDNILPGNGYWIKVNGVGTLILSNVMTSSNRIKIEEIEELPPAPPEIISSEQRIPNEFILTQNYPNPFNPTTVIKYGLPEEANVTLSVFNTLGQEVALLASGFQKAGYHEVTFDGSGLASGVYFYRIQANNYLETKKLLLMK